MNSISITDFINRVTGGQTQANSSAQGLGDGFEELLSMYQTRAETLQSPEIKQNLQVKDNINKMQISEQKKKELKSDYDDIKDDNDRDRFLEKLDDEAAKSGGAVNEAAAKKIKDVVRQQANNAQMNKEDQQSMFKSQLNVQDTETAETDASLDDMITEVKNMLGSEGKNALGFVKLVNINFNQDSQTLTADVVKGNGEKSGGNSKNLIMQQVKVSDPKSILKFADMLEVSKENGIKKLTIQLRPHDLGKMNVELIDQAGKISAKLMFENEGAKNLMMSQMEALKQQLAEKGIIVENMEFLFTGSEDFNESDNNYGFGKKKGQAQNIILEEEVPEEEADINKGIYA